MIIYFRFSCFLVKIQILLIEINKQQVILFWSILVKIWAFKKGRIQKSQKRPFQKLYETRRKKTKLFPAFKPSNAFPTREKRGFLFSGKFGFWVFIWFFEKKNQPKMVQIIKIILVFGKSKNVKLNVEFNELGCFYIF